MNTVVLYLSTWHGSCNSLNIINKPLKGLNMRNQVTDTIIYILGFIAILVVWLTA